jgi:hypothetical protein
MTILHKNVPVLCGASYHLLGFRFWLHVESYISDWQFSKSRLLMSYVFRHTAMAYDKYCCPTKYPRWKKLRQSFPIAVDFFSSTTKKCTARTTNCCICVWRSTYIHIFDDCKERPYTCLLESGLYYWNPIFLNQWDRVIYNRRKRMPIFSPPYGCWPVFW